jgi:hypothetical protein
METAEDAICENKYWWRAYVLYSHMACELVGRLGVLK